MENATKALLIAAAVLIAILLISLGVGVFNKASEQMSNADLSEYEIQKFNEKFTQYASNNTSGAEVNALVDTVVTHNNAPGTSRFVKVTGVVTVTGAKVTVLPNKVPTGSRYSITCKMDANGFVNEVAVAAAK